MAVESGMSDGPSSLADRMFPGGGRTTGPDFAERGKVQPAPQAPAAEPTRAEKFYSGGGGERLGNAVARAATAAQPQQPARPDIATALYGEQPRSTPARTDWQPPAAERQPQPAAQKASLADRLYPDRQPAAEYQ